MVVDVPVVDPYFHCLSILGISEMCSGWVGHCRLLGSGSCWITRSVTPIGHGFGGKIGRSHSRLGSCPISTEHGVIQTRSDQVVQRVVQKINWSNFALLYIIPFPALYSSSTTEIVG